MSDGGPAIPVVPVTDRPVSAAPALRVAVVSDGRPIEGGPTRPVYVVTDNRPTQGNTPMPVVLATGAQAGHVMAGPAIPVVVVSGSLGGSPPVNTVLPAISGILTISQILSATNGTWTNSPTSYTYQWKRNGANIGGATASTYTTVVADSGTTITVTVTASNASGSASATSAGSAMRTLTFYDEFSGGSLDLAKWLAVPVANENGGHAYEPGELQANIAGAITEGAGLLTITARLVNPPGPQVSGLDYTSGSPNTYGIFSQAYGRFEIRCKIPAVSGTWPAFWLYPSNPNLVQGNGLTPEIDVMEVFGNALNQLSMGWRATDGVWDRTLLATVDLSLAYHVFTCEWSLNQVEWFLDGVSVFTATHEIGSQPLYVIIQLSIGGSAGVPGTLPATLLSDYVYVYSTLDSFTPNTQSPFFWMQADKSALANNAAVSSAKESSGFILTGTQATGTKQPINKTNVINGHSAFLFDGVDDILNTPSMPANITTGDFTFWCVANSSNVSGATYRCLAGRGFAPGFYILNTHPHIYWLGDKPFSTVLANNAWYLLWFERKSGTIRCYVNGVVDATTYAVATSWANGPLNIGDDGSSPFNGYIAEPGAIYNKSFSIAERQQFEAYVSARYGFF